MEDKKERKKRDKGETKEFSHQKHLAEAETKEKNNVKEPKPKGNKNKV